MILLEKEGWGKILDPLRVQSGGGFPFLES